MDVDKLSGDLLVVVLAILTDAIPRSAAAEVIKSWTENTGRPLVECLREKTGLDEPRVKALECLASAHLKAHENDVRLSLTAWNALEVTQDMLTEIGDDSLRTTLGATINGDKTLPVEGGRLDDSSASFMLQNPLRAASDRFRLIRQHARGGIGQVWLARDGELQRDVAVKEIQPKYAESESQRARFVLEAEITGNLEHPGIVPVYSLGRNADGRPFYAMRFIEGESFSAAIRRFHHTGAEQDSNKETGKRPTWGIEFRLLLRRFLDVCDAIDFAHSRKVLHRDLKPANIMLGRYGETLVVDWGLAKVIGKNDVFPPDDPQQFEPDSAGASFSSSGHTEQGTTIGTPSYMSPEQARGDIDQLGPASDVYSLGATLYELLTGKVPFPGKHIAQVIEKVMKGDFKAPRVLDRAIPAPLEAICLKAMALEPTARYPSVHDLAQDLEHWLADEPVAAYRERRLERFGRWLRQHRTLTYAATTALVGVSVVAIAAAVVIEGGRRRETAARVEAEANFDMAQQAVDDYLTKVSENTLLKEQNSVDIRGLRRELLENALRYYKQFVSQRRDDPTVRRRLATAFFRVGQITGTIGSGQDAIAAFQSSLKIWESEAAAYPDDDQFKSRMADCHLAICIRLHEMGDLPKAMDSVNQARSILENVASRHRLSVNDQACLANCYDEIGLLQGNLESGDQGLEMLEKATALQQQLIVRGPDLLARRQKLAQFINDVGFVYFKRNDFPAAIRSFQKLQELCVSLIDEITEGPTPVELLSLLALSHYNVATMHVAQRQNEKALESFEKSLEYRRTLVDLHPSVSTFQEQLAKSYREVAIEEHKAGHSEIGLQNLRKALDILDRLSRSESEQARYHAELGRTWNAIGYIHDEMRNNQKAIPAFKSAIKEQESAIARLPENNEYKTYLCIHLENLAEQYLDLGSVSDAWPFYERAIEMRRKLNADHPDSVDYAQILADSLSRLGSIQRNTGEPTAALKFFADERSVANRFLKTKPENSTLRCRLADAITREAWAQFDLKQTEVAIKSLQDAVEAIEPLASSANAQSERRDYLTEILQARAVFLRSLNQSAAADKANTDRLALWEGQPGQGLANLALVQVGRAALIGYGKTSLVGLGRRARDLDLELAAMNLKLALTRGFADLPTLRSRPESTVLLERDDIKPMISDVESHKSSTPAQSPK
jgi:eukaryotic-like serine/threonine-protein kinase